MVTMMMKLSNLIILFSDFVLIDTRQLKFAMAIDPKELIKIMGTQLSSHGGIRSSYEVGTRYNTIVLVI